MRGWLGANTFLLTIAIIAAALIFLELSLVRAFHVPADVERVIMAVAGVLSLFGTYFIARWLHRLLARVVERAR
jgi:hypothetical protein